MATTHDIKKKFVGNKFWLVFWIFIFWPMAIVYWIMRQEYKD